MLKFINGDQKKHRSVSQMQTLIMAEGEECNGGYGSLLDWLDIGDESSSMDPFINGDSCPIADQDHEDFWEAALPAMDIHPETQFVMEPSFSSNDSVAPTAHRGDAESFWAEPPLNDVEDSSKITKKRKRTRVSGESTKGKLWNVFENNAASPHTGESVDHGNHCLAPEIKLSSQLGAESDNQLDLEATRNNSNNNNNSSNSNNKGRSGGRQSSPPNLPKESRWAEQLLNPCAVAIANNNIVRIQHLIWVLHDLASVSGDANHRLAAHGLRAFTAKIMHAGGTLPCSEFLSADPKLFHKALLKFHEVSPWYQLLYTIANRSLLEAFEDQTNKALHVIDIGVSHGIQWPTFIEALARRPAGPPSLLRLTIIADTLGAPFSAAPPCNDFPNRLKRYAKSLNLDMEVNVIAQPLDSLTREALGIKEDEALAICAQFRLHQLLEEGLDKNEGKDNQLTSVPPRDKFIKFIKDLNPLVFFLSDNDIDHSFPDFIERFKNSVDHLWRFLDSTSVCFKGRECEERRMVEGEAAMGLVNNVAYDGASRVERNESHLSWGNRVREGGFVCEIPSDKIIDCAKAMLRKHDSNWEMRLEDGCISLCWKSHPVTFCSLWKPCLNEPT